MNEFTEKFINEMLEEYPYLRKVLLPTAEKFPLLYEGFLVRKEEIKLYGIANEKDASLISFYARIIIPNDYIFMGIQVYDVFKKIPVEYIIKYHYDHAHFNDINSGMGTLLCTHIVSDTLGYSNPILANVNTAHYLYLNYVNLQNEKSFNMKEFSHGHKGIQEFIIERSKKNERYKRKF